jgi:transcriptional regulator with XRE-family HTH domain
MIAPEEESVIAVRAFLDHGALWIVPATIDRRRRFQTPDIGLSEWTLIFDTETTTDAVQQLRFGCYQLRKGYDLDEAGIFYDPASLSDDEQALVAEYATACRCRLMTVEGFIGDIFYGIGYDLGAMIVGFNLPFDLSRLAIRHASARGKTMRGGFSFQLSPDKRRPSVQIKHLSRRAALIRFAAKRGQRTGRGMRRRGMRVAHRRGYFLDVRTLAAALTSQTFSLARLAEFLNLADRKQATGNHGGPLTRDYLDYAMQDVQTTWACFETLRERYAQHRLTGTPVYRILSEAGLGKAYLREMGVKPWRETSLAMPTGLIGQIMSTYYGGRAEVRLRRVVRQIAYCDFLSMYPTVCTLMKLWRFVIADGMRQSDATAEVRNLLAAVSPDRLQRPEFWASLPVIVQVCAEGDLFPVRTRYGQEPNYTIGLNHLSSEQPLWFTLADCIAATLLSGKAPQVLQAIRFTPGAVQRGLKPVDIAGHAAYRIDPARDDFYRRLIDLRSTIKNRMRGTRDIERSRFDAEQMALKILANATSYGIFMELNAEELSKCATAICYGTDGAGKPIIIDQAETPGKFFHPLLATLITGAARLMLASGERLVQDTGLDWVFCDTDSLAIARPETMEEDAFWVRVRTVREWFAPLNPYAEKAPLLKLEDANFSIDRRDDREPLYAFAISAKRYALFNRDARGCPVLRKASAHGLGHLIAPYHNSEAPEFLPKPAAPLSEIGVERWQHDVWHRIITAALDDHPGQVETHDLPRFTSPAVSRYAATTPRLLAWFKRFNRKRPYRQQVRPFGFLLAFQAHRLIENPAAESGPASPARKQDHAGLQQSLAQPAKAQLPKVVAPYDTDLATAARRSFNRETGAPVPRRQLKTYRQALVRYHLHPEAKFHHGDFTDRGRTERRHLRAISIALIGKEANRWEEQFFLGLDPEAQNEYGLATADRERLRDTIREAIKAIGMGKFATITKWSRQHLYDILAGRKSLPDAELARLAAHARHVTASQSSATDILPLIRQRCDQIGLRQFAARARMAHGHLSLVLSGQRQPSPKLLARLRQAIDPGYAGIPYTPKSQAVLEPETKPTDPLPSFTTP